MATLEDLRSGERLNLPPRAVIGRDARSDVCIDDRRVSASHALIFWSDDAWHIRDLGSRNGTSVNGDRVHHGEARVLHSGMRLSFGSREREYTLVDDLSPAAIVDRASERTEEAGTSLRTAHLCFRVSADEETVQIALFLGPKVVKLPERSHNYLLLTLARQRLADSKGGSSDAEAGWVFADDLARRLGMEVETLNVQVHRARRQFADFGFDEASCAIERRTGAKQLRIGIGSLDVRRGA